MVVLSLIVAIYYNVIMCYTLFFTFASFQGGAIAPWSECNTGELACRYIILSTISPHNLTLLGVSL